MKIMRFCVILEGRYWRDKIMEKLKRLYKKHSEIANYLIFGVATTLVNWIVYSVAVKSLSASMMISDPAMVVNASNILAVVLAVSFAFVTNKIWVFKSKTQGFNAIAKEALSFFGSRAVTGLIEIGGVPLLQFMGLNQKIFGIDGMLAKISISVVIIVLNYIFSKFIVFKKQKQ